MTGWRIGLVQRLVYDVPVALVEIDLLSLSNWALDPRLDLKALLNNLFSLDR